MRATLRRKWKRVISTGTSNKASPYSIETRRFRARRIRSTAASVQGRVRACRAAAVARLAGQPPGSACHARRRYHQQKSSERRKPWRANPYSKMVRCAVAIIAIYQPKFGSVADMYSLYLHRVVVLAPSIDVIDGADVRPHFPMITPCLLVKLQFLP